jgi:hypothetical protein|tara:strand:+ start:4157 stop:4954 length:798 start_codon:yes stop_codon:yes gene_type:complete
MSRIIIFFLFISSFSFSQEKWEIMSKYNLKDQSIWQADLLGNLYIADKDLLTKYDTAGVLQYSQSIKSKGRIDAILPINTMKIMLFSTQQQTFTIFDNTLSEVNKTYDLSAMGFGYVTMLAVSSQPNKVWVYDQLNSKLVLVDLGRSNQQQEIENLRGLLNSTEIVWMKEEGNQLYLFDGLAKIYVFDLYGSLLDVFDVPMAEKVEVNNEEIFVMMKGSVSRFRIEDKSLEKIEAPVSGVTDFQWVNSIFFFRVTDELLKFRLYL